MDIRRLVGRNVRRIRESRGWSQEELAFESGLHGTYVSGVERGVRNPTVLVLAEIATALRVAPADLLAIEPLSFRPLRIKKRQSGR
jgi:transcriptional regulator with XRE-family HTH domain